MASRAMEPPYSWIDDVLSRSRELAGRSKREVERARRTTAMTKRLMRELRGKTISAKALRAKKGT